MKRKKTHISQNKERQTPEQTGTTQKQVDRTRRRFLYALMGVGVAAVGGISVPVYNTYFSQKAKVVEAIEHVIGKKLDPKKDYHFYNGSRTVELYLPDKHKPEYQDQQRHRIKTLSQALENNGVPIAAAGLEGIAHGIHTNAKLGALKSKRDVEIKKSQDEYLTGFENLRQVAKLQIDEGHNRDSTLAFFKKINKIIHSSHELTLSEVFNQDDKDWVHAPGLAYFDLFPVNYGLEKKDSFYLDLNIIKFTRLQATEVALLQCLEELDRKVLPKVKAHDQYERFRNHVDRQLNHLRSYFSQVKGNIPEAIEAQLPHLDRTNVNLDNFKKVIESSYYQFSGSVGVQRALDRTEHWVSAAPSGISGVVAVIGGMLHDHDYRYFAQKKRQSYVMLPRAA